MKQKMTEYPDCTKCRHYLPNISADIHLGGCWLVPILRDKESPCRFYMEKEQNEKETS